MSSSSKLLDQFETTMSGNCLVN